jgi:hypothetical protein
LTSSYANPKNEADSTAVSRGGGTAVKESQNPTKQHDIADLIAVVK